ncbi:MAG TPA: hypothetical protein VFV23_10795 [Verrucomicrobiae bacterium]|nr:hypothetical protein [Verrucomicrobiae bacterium]
MLNRLGNSIFFCIGGFVTWFLLRLLQDLGAAQAGMSDAGSGSGVPIRGTISLWLFCSYFFVGAVSVILTNDKSILLAVFFMAHILLLVAYCLVCSIGFDDGEFLKTAFIFALIITVFYSPWLILWKSVLKNAKLQKFPQSNETSDVKSSEERKNSEQPRIKAKY